MEEKSIISQYEKMLDELKQLLPLSENRLDSICDNHALLMYKSGELHVKLEGLLAQAELSMDKIKGEAAIDIRKYPIKYGIDVEKLKGSFTEGFIKDIMMTSNNRLPIKYRNARVYFNNIETLKRMAERLWKAFERRTQMIDNRVELWVRGYVTDVGSLRSQKSRGTLTQEKLQRHRPMESKNE